VGRRACPAMEDTPEVGGVAETRWIAGIHSRAGEVGLAQRTVVRGSLGERVALPGRSRCGTRAPKRTSIVF